VPKDGPSAGIAIVTAFASLLTGRAVRRDVAMTGEVTLRGRVLAIGGLKEKVIAAHRDGLKLVLFPRANAKDLEEIPAEVKKDLQLQAVGGADEVLKIALEKTKARKTARPPARPALRPPPQLPQPPLAH
jgi:ATP-dependent Lon protease